MQKTLLLRLTFLFALLPTGLRAQTVLTSPPDEHGISWLYVREMHNGYPWNFIVGETRGAANFHGVMEIPNKVRSGGGWVTFEGIGTDTTKPFEGYNGITDIKIHGFTSSPIKNAFHGCNGLVNLTLDPGHYSSCFYNCANLESLNFGNASISRLGIKGCPKLNSITMTYPFLISVFLENVGITSLDNIHVPAEVNTGLSTIQLKNCPNISVLNISRFSKLNTLSITGCPLITDVTVPASVRYMQVGVDLWANNTGLNRVRIEGNIDLQGYTFDGCPNLRTVEMPQIKSIGLYAFRNCPSLRELVIPGTCETIQQPFGGSVGLEKLWIYPGAGRVLANAFSGLSTLKYLYIAAREVGANAFQNCGNLQTVDISKEVTTWGGQSFANCAKLVKANIYCPTTGANTFYNCTSLNEVNFGPDVRTINSYSFNNCTGLQQVGIPRNVETLESNAFINCQSLMKANIFAKDIYPAFTNNVPLTELNLGDGVEIIRDGAFADKSTLRGNLMLPSTLQSVGQGAFRNCPFSGTLFVYAQQRQPENAGTLVLRGTVGNPCFSGTNFANITLGGASPAIIGKSVPGESETRPAAYGGLENNARLSTLTIQPEVQVIGNSGLDGLKLSATGTLVIPSNVLEIRNYAFNGAFTTMSGAQKLNLYARNVGLRAFNSCSALTEVGIAREVTTWGGQSFANCTGLVKTNIFSPTTGTNTFYNCTSLNEVNFGPDVRTINSYSFNNCTGLQQVGIPRNVETLETNAFANCVSLKKVNIAAKDIYPAFTNNVPLTEVNLGEGAETIRDDVFAERTSLQGNLVLPSTLRTIGNRAFYHCTGLTGSMRFENITVGELAFGECTGLSGTLTFGGNVILGARHEFQHTNFTRLKFESNQLPLVNYNTFGNWGEAHIPLHQMTIRYPASVTTFPDYFLQAMNNVVGDLSIPSGVTYVGKCAFAGTQLKGNVDEFLKPITYVGHGAFENCANITGNWTLSSVQTSVDLGTFRGSGLSGELRIPANVPIDNIYASSTVNYPYLKGLKIESSNPMFCNDYHGIQNVIFYGTGTLKYIDVRNATFSSSGYGHGADTNFKFIRRTHPAAGAGWGNGPDNILNFYNFVGLEMNTIVYMPTESSYPDPYTTSSPGATYHVTMEQRFGEDGCENFVIDGKCYNFLVATALDYKIPMAFTALKARCDRTFSNTSGKAVSTLYLPYPTDLPIGMTAYSLVHKSTNLTDKSFVFTAVPAGQRLEANHPYLVRVTDGNTHTLPVMPNVTVPVTPDIETSSIQASWDNDWKFYGTTERISNEDAYARHAYYLANNKWWPVQNGVENDYIAPFRCFLASPTGVAPSKGFVMVFEEGDNRTTDIRQLENSTDIDIRSGKYPFYTLDGKYMGRDYDRLVRGQMYIVNGKKFYKL